VNILLVEDHTVTREYMEVLLKDAGYQVKSVASATEGLSCLGIAVPDLVITDLFMPGMDGIEMVRRLRNLPGCQLVPVVMLSAADPDRLGNEALVEDLTDLAALGPFQFLNKPIGPEYLVTVVGSYRRADEARP
jgi:CheY-like chemotaxis protein